MSFDPSQAYIHGGNEYQSQQHPQDRAPAPQLHSQSQPDPRTTQPIYDSVRPPPPPMIVSQYPQPVPQATDSYLGDPTMTWQNFQSPHPQPSNLQPPPSTSRWPTHLSITLPQNVPAGPSTTSPLSVPYSAGPSSTSPLPNFAVPYYPNGSPFPSPRGNLVISPGVHSALSSSLPQPSPPLQEYFPTYQGNPPPTFHPPLAPLSTATSPSKHQPGSSRSTSTGSQNGRAGAKTTRQQFTACGACKHRRVGCDLKDKQAAAERQVKKNGKKVKVSCTNCITRGINCVDEFAPVKAAKQLRRGKRISEIEHLYGVAGDGATDGTDPFEFELLGKDNSSFPELGPGFWQSHWLRGFVQHRPFIDLSQPPRDSLLHKAIFACAVACGIDEHGNTMLDEGSSPAETPPEDGKELRRQAASERLKPILETILRDIDLSGVLRRPHWDSVRLLLLLLPLVNEHLLPLEAHAMRDAVSSHVLLLSQDRLAGSPVSPQNLLTDIKTLWYAYVVEGLHSGLQGQRLHLDYVLVDRFSKLVESTAPNAMEYMKSRSMVAPNLIVSQTARLLNSFHVQSQEVMSNDSFTQIMGLLDRGWHGAQMLSYDQSMDSDVSVALGCRLDLFVVINSLYTILTDEVARSGTHAHAEDQRLRQLIEAVQSKCSTLSKVLVDSLRSCLSVLFYGSSTFEDAIYHIGKWQLQCGGSAEDVGLCISILNDSPWCFSKAWARSSELRDDLARRTNSTGQQWSTSPAMVPPSINPYVHPPMLLTTPIKIEAGDTPSVGYPAQQTHPFYYQPYDQAGISAPFPRQFWQPTQQNPKQ